MRLLAESLVLLGLLAVLDGLWPLPSQLLVFPAAAAFLALGVGWRVHRGHP